MTGRRPASIHQIMELLEEGGLTAYGDADEPVLTTSEVASVLRCSDRTVRTWADTGKIDCLRTLGGHRLFPRSAVVAALERMRNGGSNGLADHPASKSET